MDLIKYLVSELQTLLNAPILSCVLVVVGFFVGRLYYVRAISSQKAEISLLKTQIVDLDRRLETYGTRSELPTDETTLLHSEAQETNIQDHFPFLNEAALKKHVALAVSHCPFGKSIKQVLLLATSTAKFQYLLLVVSEGVQDTKGLEQYWDRDAHYIFEDNFIEVYRDKPKVISPNQKGSFWHEWNIMVLSSFEEIPHDLALKKYKWVLY